MVYFISNTHPTLNPLPVPYLSLPCPTLLYLNQPLSPNHSNHIHSDPSPTQSQRQSQSQRRKYKETFPKPQPYLPPTIYHFPPLRSHDLHCFTLPYSTLPIPNNTRTKHHPDPPPISPSLLDKHPYPNFFPYPISYSIPPFLTLTPMPYLPQLNAFLPALP